MAKHFSTNRHRESSSRSRVYCCSIGRAAKQEQEELAVAAITWGRRPQRQRQLLVHQRVLRRATQEE